MELEEADSGSDSTVPPIQGGVPALSHFIENMGLHYEQYGVPRIGGRILGLLMVTDHEVSAEEMADVLQVSRSSISTNLRMLLMAGLVERVAIPGDRRDYYLFASLAWQRSLDLRLEGVKSLRSMAEDGLDDLQHEHPARTRLEEVIRWADLLEDAYGRLRVEWQSLNEVPA